MRAKNHGGDGSSTMTAVIVEASNILEGTDAEYAHIGGVCGL